MSADRNALYGWIHQAMKHHRVSEEDYRAVLQSKFGVGSKTDLSERQLNELLTHLNGGKRYRPKSKNPHAAKIFAIWGEMCRQGIPEKPTSEALIAFVKRMTGVDDPDWIGVRPANVVIEALKDWQRRELEKRK